MGSVALARRRTWTVADFQAMHAAGVLGEQDRVELLDGEVVRKVVIGPRHAGGVTRVQYALLRTAQAYLVSVQNPVVVGLHSQPEPDLSVLQPRADFYSDRHPEVADVVLLVEVADTCAAADRRDKLPLYAAGGIVEVWLVDVEQGAVEVHRGPGPAGYSEVTRHTTGELKASAAPTISVSVAEVLGATAS